MTAKENDGMSLGAIAPNNKTGQTTVTGPTKVTTDQSITGLDVQSQKKREMRMRT